jgi:endoglucanase
VGTPTWSQDVDQAAANPLTYSNIMYALHFYSGTHGQSLRDKANLAMAQNAAIFITEFGTSEASGTGGPYTAQADEWLAWADQNRLSWCNWSITTKSETSAALKPDAGMAGPWTDSQLSTSGLWVKGKLGGASVTLPPTAAPTPVPTQVPGATPTAVPTVGPTNPPSTGCATTASGNITFNTMSAFCFQTQTQIAGWGGSNCDGRTVSVTVNGTGTPVTVVGGALPPKQPSDYYVFQWGPGSLSYSSTYWW